MNKNTIKQAAELAGVSIASVSRALNGKPGISEETRLRIIAICDKLGYQPSDAARRLKIGRQSHVSLCLGVNDTQHSHYISSLFDALNKLLLDQGLALSVYSADQIGSLIKESGAVIVTGMAEGDTRPERLRKAGLPFVVIGRSQGDFWVCPDDAMGGRIAAQHLLELGCQRPVIVESILEGKTTKPRATGFQEFMQHNHQVPGHLSIDDAVATELQSYRTVMQMLQKGAFPFDAAFCENDEMAYGTLLACQDFGLKVPEEIKIVGFDDLPGFFNEITTVRQDIGTIAQSAVKLLAEAKQHKPQRDILIPVELISRASTITS